MLNKYMLYVFISAILMKQVCDLIWICIQDKKLGIFSCYQCESAIYSCDTNNENEGYFMYFFTFNFNSSAALDESVHR